MTAEVAKVVKAPWCQGAGGRSNLQICRLPDGTGMPWDPQNIAGNKEVWVNPLDLLPPQPQIRTFLGQDTRRTCKLHTERTEDLLL